MYSNNNKYLKYKKKYLDLKGGVLTLLQINVYVMRHGDRADDHEATPEVQATVDRIEDTPLSPAGLHTALTRSATLLKSNHFFTKIVSSPMLRCVQTADVAEKVFKTGFVMLNNNIREVWHPKVLKRALSEVRLRTKSELDLHNIKSKLIIDFSPFDAGEETRGVGGSADRRFRDSITTLAKQAALEGHKELLIVTHGDAIGSFVALTHPGHSIYEVNYCGFVGATLEFQIQTESQPAPSTGHLPQPSIADRWTFIEDLQENSGVGIMAD